MRTTSKRIDPIASTAVHLRRRAIFCRDMAIAAPSARMTRELEAMASEYEGDADILDRAPEQAGLQL
jgi:hypothetical protein